MYQKSNLPKTDIRRSKPWKQVNFLTVRANCDFEQTLSEKKQPPRCYPLVSRRLGLAYQYAEARRCNGVAVGVCALGVVLGCGRSWREGCPGRWRWRGGRCAPWCRSGAWLLMGAKLLRSGRGRGGRRGVSAHSIEVAQIVSRVRPAYQGIKYDIYIMY